MIDTYSDVITWIKFSILFLYLIRISIRECAVIAENGQRRGIQDEEYSSEYTVRVRGETVLVFISLNSVITIKSSIQATRLNACHDSFKKRMET